MNRRLYVINSPSYAEIHPSHTCGQVLLSDPLSEHFTYMYANFIKYGLIDDVVIFPRSGPHDKFKDEISNKIIVENQKTISINWERNKIHDVINFDKNSYVYSWSNYDMCENLQNAYVLVNPVVANHTNNRIDSKIHHYGLIEGMSHERRYHLLPKDIPVGVCPLTSKSFTESSFDDIKNAKKEYDWIMVSSFDPRKRHLEFLNSISKNSNFSKLRGCIIGRNPDNKGRLNDGHHVFNEIVRNYRNNLDIFLNVSNETKIELLSKSKIFVCTSSYDFGPRASIEAMQLGLPILSSPHMGACDWIYEGENGEIINNIEDSANVLYKMIFEYENGKYAEGTKNISQKLKPESIFPNLVQDIIKHSNLKKA